MCNICGKESNSRTNLMSHIKSQHESKVVKCDICDFPSKTKNHLLSNMKTHVSTIHQGVRHTCLKVENNLPLMEH